MIYPLEPKILICIDLHLPFCLYELAFSKQLHTYSLNMPVLCLSSPFMHSSLCIPNISISTYFPFLSMPYKLGYALKTQKWKGSRNCLAIYEGPFCAWWNTNYIAFMHKWKETEKTQACQTCPRWSDIAWHSLPKLVKRIKSSMERVWNNPAAWKPRSLAISLWCIVDITGESPPSFCNGLGTIYIANSQKWPFWSYYQRYGFGV